jgi:hypothetical protein
MPDQINLAQSQHQPPQPLSQSRSQQLSQQRSQSQYPKPPEINSTINQISQKDSHKKNNKKFLFVSTVVIIIFLLLGVIVFLIYERNMYKSDYEPNNLSQFEEEQEIDNDPIFLEESEKESMDLQIEGPPIISSESTPSSLLSTTEDSKTSSLPVYDLDQTHVDDEFKYSVSYSEDWLFRETYGPDIEKIAPTNVLRGFDLHIYHGEEAIANVGVNVLHADGLVDIVDWINEHELNEPRGEKKQIHFNGVLANYYTYQDRPDIQNRALYFIKSGNIYKIWWWGKTDQALDQATAIVETFKVD